MVWRVFLGTTPDLEKLNKKLKKQNPKSATEKVRNPDEMARGLARLDRFNLSRTPNFEPRRGPVVQTYILANEAPLLYLPIKGGPDDCIIDWLAALDGVSPDELSKPASHKLLRQWMRNKGTHRKFTILRHPLARAHHAFCKYILSTGPESYASLRSMMRRRYKFPIPADAPDDSYDLLAHQNAFLVFLKFLKGNLAEQTSIRVDSSWCSQGQAIQGFGAFAPPDVIIREEQMASELSALAGLFNLNAPEIRPAASDIPFELRQIYTPQMEELAREAYRRDYLMFGFSDWSSVSDT